MAFEYYLNLGGDPFCDLNTGVTLGGDSSCDAVSFLILIVC
jgi:hypothetical protein